MSLLDRIRDAAAFGVLRIGPRGRRATGRLAPIVTRLRVPTAVVDGWIRLQLAPPNGLEIRPQLLAAATGLQTRAPSDRTFRLYLRVLAEQCRAGLSGTEVGPRAVAATSSDHASVLADFVQVLVEQGDLDAARAVVSSLPQGDDRTFLATHRLAVMQRDETTATGLETHCALPDAAVERARVQRLQHLKCHAEIARRAEDDDSTIERSTTIDALVELGRTAEVFSLVGEMPPDDRNAVRGRLECFILEGDEHAASDELNSNLSLVIDDRRLLRIARSIFDHVGRERLEIADQFTLGPRPTTQSVERRLVALVELGFVEEALALWSGTRRPTLLGPHAGYAVAQALYARREFEQARAVAEMLSGSVRHADSRKLLARIDFECGDFGRSLARRLREGYPTGHLDEVVYHARLQLGERGAAMAMYCPDLDRERIERATLEQSTTSGPDHECFVLAQSGPGDEIQLAGLYSRLQHVHESVAVTADPRLVSLFRRSFPDITVLPASRRTRRHQWGFAASGQPARAPGDLAGLLTADADQHRARSGRVMLARQLPGRFLRDGSPPRSTGYLIANRDRRTEMAEVLESLTRSTPGRARVGVVWRSELRDLMRQLHYLDIAGMDPILRRPHTFVCLQHDVELSEIREATQLAGEGSFIVTDVDLRDDLDGAAALISELDAVVGVGTTLTEMSSALGVPTVLIQPNHFGSWRSTDSSGSDFWYESTRVATIRHAPSTRFDARGAARQLDEVLGNTPSPARPPA